MPWFKITGEVRNREVIASGHGIRDLSKLRANYGDGNWRKCNGEATIEVADVDYEKLRSTGTRHMA